MNVRHQVSRRGFVGGLATALGYVTLTPSAGLLAQGVPTDSARRRRPPGDEYDALAKLSANENPYGPPDSVLQAMSEALKYANRYFYPDGGITEEIASHHGVKTENILLGAGSGEILDVAANTFLQNGKKMLSSNPSYDVVLQHVTGIKADTIKVPLTADFRQDIPALIRAAKRDYRSIGFVYLCSPNNPTGRMVPASEVKQLLDGIPEDLPVLIDEAYFHFVDDPAYATSVPYVIEGRQVIVTRTFSKIAALAGMRLGYAVAPKELIVEMRPLAVGSINALVKWGGVAALKDTESQAKVKRLTLDIRNRTMTDLRSAGYSVIPSDANFFMVQVGRPVQPVVDEFRKKGVLVGRPFPAPLHEHLRVSVGTADEMHRFMAAFKEIVPAGATKTARSGS